MTFVNDHVDPFVAAQERSILDDILVGGQADLP